MSPRLSASALRRDLGGGDRRSLGGVSAVLQRDSRHPGLVALLVRLLEDGDSLVRMRAADALEKLTAARPLLLRRFTGRLLRLAGGAEQQELRWHLAQIMPRLRLTARQRVGCVRTLRRYLEDRSSIVRTCALHALAELAQCSRSLRPQVEELVQEALRTGTPAMRARARLLLARHVLQRPLGQRVQSRR
jgi:hypothetical protein